MLVPEACKRLDELVAQVSSGLRRPDLRDAVAKGVLNGRIRRTAAREKRDRGGGPYEKQRANATIVAPVSTNPNHEVGQREYAEVVGALVAVRRFAGEMSDVYADFGRADQQEDAGARAMVDACDRALDALDYDGAR
jgi:hypothetical protein